MLRSTVRSTQYTEMEYGVYWNYPTTNCRRARARNTCYGRNCLCFIAADDNDGDLTLPKPLSSFLFRSREGLFSRTDSWVASRHCVAGRLPRAAQGEGLGRAKEGQVRRRWRKTAKTIERWIFWMFLMDGLQLSPAMLERVSSRLSASPAVRRQGLDRAHAMAG